MFFLLVLEQSECVHDVLTGRVAPSDGRLFPIQMGNEEQQEKLLREWLDCCVTEGGVLVALQKSSRRRNHPLVTQMVEKWLDGYRQIRPCASLSDGEEEEDDDDE